MAMKNCMLLDVEYQLFKLFIYLGMANSLKKMKNTC